MANNIIYSLTALNSKFQAYNAGNVSGYNPVQTNVKFNNTDINTILSPRDNNPDNAATSTGAIKSNSKDLTLLFNKTGATYDVTVGGSAAYTGSVRTTGVTYSGKSPTGNGVNAPSFTVPNPTVNTSSTTCSEVGTYIFNNSLTSSAVSGGRLVIRLPGNYLVGNINGSFTIFTPTPAPLAVINMVAGTGPVPAFTSGTVTGGVPPYTINAWTKINVGPPAATYQGNDGGNPTSTATWFGSMGTGIATVQMNVTDSVGTTASNTTTINWNIA
jgi:hypothetical protein